MRKHRIKLKDKEIDFSLRTNSRSKSLRLTIYRDGRIVVTRPQFLSKSRVFSFLKDRSDLILDKIKGTDPLRERDRYLEYKEKARSLVKERLEYFNDHYNFKYNRVSIRNQRTCWGSCSEKGNLNFNYRIYFLPKELTDYIIVHELCHLKELNHSKDFWFLVSQTQGDYKELRAKLRCLKI